jgi:localization factor PodJL
MKPGIPWSVKGIEQQARAAAKQAARQSGMTIGEWLNSVILDSAEGGDDLERRYRRPPYRPKPAPGAEQGEGEGEEVTLRLEEIAEQLHTIARHESDTALSRPMGPDDENQLRAIIERLDAHEQHTQTALGAMQERLEEVSRSLGGEARQAAPQRADDVPGYRALEGALRNIIEHIEISETRTRDSIKSLQERLTEPNESAEVHETEQRLRSLVEEARQASGALDSDVKAGAATQGDIDQLRLEIEQLAATVSQGSGHALADLGGRLEQLEADIKRQFSERDQETQVEVAALGQRIAATEKRLDHLATIEESVAQLARSLETGGSSSAAGEASPELKALEDGLNAVRASAEVSDRRTQETLQAVHETLEHIVGKLAELESDDGPDDESDAGEMRAEDLARDFAEEHADEPVEEPAEDLTEDLAQDETSSFDAEPESAADDSVTDGSAATTETSAEGFVFPEAPADEATDARSDDEPQAQAHEPASAEPAEPPMREDYIAAARRAAQMAATRSQNPVTSGFNKFSQRFSGSGAKEDKTDNGSAPKRGFVSSLFAGLRGRKAQTDDDAKPEGKASKRKRLIFAGLVLLAAASAYGAQRHVDSIPGFDLLGGAAIGPEKGDINSAPRADTAMRPHDALTTASIAPLGRSDAERRMAISRTLPAEIGPRSLRHAAIGGDAIAQFVVAGRYLEGRAVPRDEDKAAQWYERAAKQGLAAAQYRLGSMYEHGRGTPLDPNEAVAWYEQAAENGNINAMHNLAVLHTGSRSGRRNYELAAKWFHKAAERGLRDSQFNLAVLHEQGLGVPRSPEDAVFWYSLAAVQGDNEARAKATALEASLAPETAKQVHARLLGWQALPADRNANVVPVADPSWQGMS